VALRRCAFCGLETIGLRRGRKRKFCGDRCRLAAHRRRQPTRLRRAGVQVAVPADLDEWGDSVREHYDLSRTESELVSLGELAIAVAKDVSAAPQVRLAAVARFQSVVQQLKLEDPNDGEAEKSADGTIRPWPKRVG
jgi:hypothetical protein